MKTQDAAELASRMADLTLAGRVSTLNGYYTHDHKIVFTFGHGGITIVVYSIQSRLNPNAPAFTLNPNASVFVPRGPPPVAASADSKLPYHFKCPLTLRRFTDTRNEPPKDVCTTPLRGQKVKLNDRCPYLFLWALPKVVSGQNWIYCGRFLK